MKSPWIALTAVMTVLAGLVFLNRSGAQTAPATQPTVVAVCDVVRVFNNYERASSLSVELEKRRQAIEAENQQRAQAMDTLRAELQNLQQGSEAYNSRSQELWKMSLEQEGWENTQKGMLGHWHHQNTKAMYDDIVAMIATMAKASGIDIVLFEQKEDLPTENTTELVNQIARRKVLYNTPQVDITDQVLARLNEAWRKH
jgi:Skp family chaperone for outer membrane proteins